MSLPFLAGQAPEFTAMKALFLTVFAFYRKTAVVEARAALAAEYTTFLVPSLRTVWRGLLQAALALGQN